MGEKASIPGLCHDQDSIHLRTVISAARHDVVIENVYARQHQCGSGRCYEVGLKDTLRRKARAAKPCPAHDGKRNACISQLADILYNVDTFQAVIWDCHCVPGRADMHIDACVLCGQRWSRLEVDGAQHFEDNGSQRSKNDEVKDELMNSAGMGMLRLHYKDRGAWDKYVLWALHNTLTKVMYTASYHECLEGLPEHKCIVILK